MITQEQLRTLCEQHGGQIEVARRIRYSKDHIGKVINGIFPLTEKLTNKVQSAFPEFRW